MEYQSNSLYQVINNITLSVKEKLHKLPEFRKYQLQENQKVLIGRGSFFNNEPVGTDFDYVAFAKSGFKWSEQKNKDEVLLAARLIYKKSIRSLDLDIEQELFKLHSIQASRKILIIVNTIDEMTKENIISCFLKKYEVMLNFPPYLTPEVNLEKCPLCGTNPSRIELWFYDQNDDVLMQVSDNFEEQKYFRM